MSVSITELIWQVKTWGKSNHKVLFWKAVFHWKPIHHTKTYDPVHDLYGFLYVWPVFGHCFRLLLWKIREIQNFQCVDSGHVQTRVMRVIGNAPFLFLLFYWRKFCPVEILFMTKTTRGLILNIVWHVSINFYCTFDFVLMLRVLIVPLDFWTKRTNKAEVLGHKEGHYWTKQTFIV